MTRYLLLILFILNGCTAIMPMQDRSDLLHVQGYLTVELIRDGKVIERRGPLKNLVVNAGENFLVDAFQNLTEPESIRYHAIGTGTTAVAEGTTTCEGELTIQYNPDNIRATGTLTEGASSNIFRTVGSNTVDASATIGKFCLMTQAATGGGTVFTEILVSPTVAMNPNDTLQTTYDLTVE